MMILTAVLICGGRYAEGYCVANDLEQAQGRVYQAVSRRKARAKEIKFQQAKRLPEASA